MDESSVSEYFDEHREIYRFERRVDDIGSWDRVDSILAGIVPDGGTVVDVGCGNGHLLEYALQETPMGSGVGIDISRGMLPESASEGIEILQGSATDLPFQEDSFDVLHMSNLLHHVVGDSRSESKAKATSVIESALELVGPDGKILLTEQFHEGPIGKSRVTPKLIFFGLDTLTPLAKILDSGVNEGLLVSFYTRDELRKMVVDAGGRVESVQTTAKEPETLARKALENEYGRVHIVASQY